MSQEFEKKSPAGLQSEQGARLEEGLLQVPVTGTFHNRSGNEASRTRQRQVTLDGQAGELIEAVAALRTVFGPGGCVQQGSGRLQVPLNGIEPDGGEQSPFHQCKGMVVDALEQLRRGLATVQADQATRNTVDLALNCARELNTRLPGSETSSSAQQLPENLAAIRADYSNVSGVRVIPGWV
jgi:hypothetical protein